MPTVPFHTHNFSIPTATDDDMEVLTSASVVVTPANLTNPDAAATIVDLAAPPASQAEAEAGTDAVKRMTPLTTAQAIDFLVSTAGLSGAYADLTGKPTLGNSSPLDVGTIAGTVAAGNDSRITGAVQSSYLTPRLPGLSDNVQGTGVPGLDGGTFFFYKAHTTPSPSTTLRIDRRANFVGGAAGVASALSVYVNAGKDATYFEWASSFVIENQALGTTNSENVAMAATGRKILNGVGEVGKTWAGLINGVDFTGVNNPSQSLVGLEIGIYGAPNTLDANRQRVGLYLALGGEPGSHTGDGMVIGGTAGSIIDRGISFRSLAGAAGAFGIGIDFTDATLTAAIMMKPGQRWVVDANVSGAYGRAWSYNSNLMTYETPFGAVLNISDGGNLGIAGQLAIGGANSTSAAGGAASPPPANPVGYFPITYGGVTRKVAYYN